MIRVQSSYDNRGPRFSYDFVAKVFNFLHWRGDGGREGVRKIDDSIQAMPGEEATENDG